MEFSKFTKKIMEVANKNSYSTNFKRQEAVLVSSLSFVENIENLLDSVKEVRDNGILDNAKVKVTLENLMPLLAVLFEVSNLELENLENGAICALENSYENFREKLKKHVQKEEENSPNVTVVNIIPNAKKVIVGADLSEVNEGLFEGLKNIKDIENYEIEFNDVSFESVSKLENFFKKATNA